MAEVTPFQINISDEAVADLQARLTNVRFPGEIKGVGRTRGVPLSELQELVAIWKDAFDWRKQEALLNQLPQFVTNIDGQQIHFVHVRSKEANAMPLILCHGWPGSFVDFHNVIAPLVDPVSFGGNADDAFHVVIPSLPGFAFSNPVVEAGWSPGRMAKALDELMNRLEYETYATQGGDIGSGVIGLMAALNDKVIGVHANTDLLGAAAMVGTFAPVPEGTLNDQETERLDEYKSRTANDYAYLQIQSTRPQTLSYSLSDSPAGLLAWMAEKWQSWTNPAIDSLSECIDIQQFLTNVSIYWFTNSGASSAHVIYEGMNAQEWGGPSQAPRAMAMYGGTDSMMRKVLDPSGELAHWNEFETGGHFPAVEVPSLFVDDVRAFYRSLR